MKTILQGTAAFTQVGNASVEVFKTKIKYLSSFPSLNRMLNFAGN